MNQKNNEIVISNFDKIVKYLIIATKIYEEIYYYGIINLDDDQFSIFLNNENCLEIINQVIKFPYNKHNYIKFIKNKLTIKISNKIISRITEKDIDIDKLIFDFDNLESEIKQELLFKDCVVNTKTDLNNLNP